MAATLRLDIVSAEKEIFSGEILSLVITGEMGELGIMPGHTPLFTSIRPGNIRAVLPDNKEEIFYVDGGMLEVQPFIATVLADTVVRAHDIDEKAALEAKERAEKLLAAKVTDVDFARANAELAQALAQIRAIQYLKKHAKT